MSAEYPITRELILNSPFQCRGQVHQGVLQKLCAGVNNTAFARGEVVSLNDVTMYNAIIKEAAPNKQKLCKTQQLLGVRSLAGMMSQGYNAIIKEAAHKKRSAKRSSCWGGGR